MIDALGKGQGERGKRERTVGSGDHDREIRVEDAFVAADFGADGAAPEGADDRCHAGRVGAAFGVGDLGGITLEEDIEGGALGVCVTDGGALGWIIESEVGVCDEACSHRRSVIVLEMTDVVGWSCHVGGAFLFGCLVRHRGLVG